MLRTPASPVVLTLVASLGTAAKAADPLPTEVRQAELLEKRVIPEGNQGIAVDAEHYYAVDNQAIAKYRKGTGELVAKWEGPEEGPILHLDSGVVVDGRLYAAHSNYPEDPMTSSVEVWDVATMEHVDSHSFGTSSARSPGSTAATAASGGAPSRTTTVCSARAPSRTATSTARPSCASARTGASRRPSSFPTSWSTDSRT
jgi:hypothetical protein